MWFLAGLFVGNRAGSGPLAARVALMCLWLLPIALGKVAVANVGPGAIVPALLLGWAVMAAFALYRPATSSPKLALIDGACGWARLVSLVAAGQILWRLYDVHFVILQADGLMPRIAICAAAITAEQGLRWWVRRDVVRRDVVFE